MMNREERILGGVRFLNLGRISYADAYRTQQHVFESVRLGESLNTVLFCEHPDVITIGRNSRNDQYLRMSREKLHENGYEVYDVDRGGDVTYHGPGQLVSYPIVRLGDYREDLGWYIRTMEEWIMRTLSNYGIQSGRMPGMTGVWTNTKKICAIGVRASRWVTMHGFALNVTTDLRRFDAIVPCGIPDYEVTSIEQETSLTPTLEEVSNHAKDAWLECFIEHTN